MATLFLPYEDVWLLERLRSCPYDCTNNVPFYCHIRTEVGRFVGTKMPNAPPPTCRHWYLLALYHLASLDPRLIPFTFFSWDLISCQHMYDTQSYAFAPYLHYHCPTNVPIHSNNTSLSSNHHPPAVISLRSQPLLATPETIDTGPRPLDAGSLIPHSLLPAFSNAKPSNQSSIPNVVVPNQHLLHPAIPVAPSTPMQEMQTNQSLSTQTTALTVASTRQPPSTPMQEMQTNQSLSTQTTALTVASTRQPTAASTPPNARGNRYVFIFGYPTPPELSGKPVVISLLQQIFPCPYGGWCRKRSDKANITFECRCPVVPANIIRLTIFGDVLHYCVPQAQGIPHDSSPDHFPSDSINPWEIDIIKGIVDAQPNLQPMIAYNLWTKTCSAHVDNLSRCPDLPPSLCSEAVTRRTLQSISIIFPRFLSFFRYYRKRRRHMLREESAPPTSVAFLWSFQTKHSFWDHLRYITRVHQFKPMPVDHFSSIDQLASHLHISHSMIFTIPVESTDLCDMDLPSDQKTKAFGSLFCVGLPHLWTLCLFLKLDPAHRALLSDFTRLSRMGVHLNVVGPCSHQINRKSKQRITRRKHSLGLQICPGELTPAVYLYHKSLQKLAPRVFAGSDFTASVDSSDQGRAVFKGTLDAHPSILKIPDKVHITRHCVEDLSWRSKMVDKKNFPGRVYHKVKLISLMLGDILTRKAWEVTLDEWNQQGEATFSAFMKRNQGPESKYGGGKINYTASRIMGVRNDNQPSEAWFRCLKGSEASQSPPVVNLTVNFQNFINEELPKAFRNDTLHVAQLTSLRSAHDTTIGVDRNVPTLVLAACALFDNDTDMSIRTKDQLKLLCQHYNQTGGGLVYIVNGLPRMGKPIRDEDIKEWLRVVYDPKKEEDDYLEYYHQINIGLSMVTPSSTNHACDPAQSLPIMVQHKNLPFRCSCRTFWDSSLCYHSLSVAERVQPLTPICLSEMFHLVYVNYPCSINRPGPKRSTHSRRRYTPGPTIFHDHFGLSHAYLDPRFLFLANLTVNQKLDLARDRKSPFHSQPQTSMTTECMMELILEGTALGEDIVQSCSSTGSAPLFLKRHQERKDSQWPPLPPVPGFGPNAGLLFKNHVYPPGVDVESPFHTCTYLIPTHAQLFRDVPNADMYLPVLLVCELLRLPLSAIMADPMLNQLRQQKDKLKKHHCGGDNLKQSVIRVLGKKHPCIASLNVVVVSVEFSENLPFHAYNVFVDQLKHCLGLPFDGSLSSTVLLKTRGNKFVIHRVVRPPMQAEYHLIDLNPVDSLNDAHGVRVVCFHVISLARLIHRIWWYYKSDTDDKANKNPGLVSLQIVTAKYPTLPTESSISSILDGLGSPVPSPNDLVPPPSIDDDDKSFSDGTEGDGTEGQAANQSSAEDKPKRVPATSLDDDVNFAEEEDRKGHEQDDVNSGSKDAHILEMELLNGKVLSTPLEDDHSASPNSSVCLEPPSLTTKRTTKRKKKKEAEILTQSCIDDSTTEDQVIVIDNSTARAQVTVEALQALQLLLNNQPLMNKRARSSLSRRVQAPRLNSRHVDADRFFETMRQKKDDYFQYLKDCASPNQTFVFLGPKPSTVCLFYSEEMFPVNKSKVLTRLFQLADTISFKSLPNPIRCCALIQILDHLRAAIHSIESLVPWKGGIENYLDACGEDRENGKLLYYLLQWIRSHFVCLTETVFGSIKINGPNSTPIMSIQVALSSKTPIQKAMHGCPPLLHCLDLRLTMYELHVAGTLIDPLTVQTLCQIFKKRAAVDPILSEVYCHSSDDWGREMLSDTDTSDTSTIESVKSESVTRNTNYHFYQSQRKRLDCLPVRILLAAVASVSVPNIYGINLYNLPQEDGLPHWDLLRLEDNFPQAIVSQFGLNSAGAYKPLKEWDAYDLVSHVTFARDRNRIRKQRKETQSDVKKGELDAFLELVSNKWSRDIYSLYREHILAPCQLCSADSDSYLTCVICTNRKMSPQCESSFSKIPEPLGIRDLRRLRNPLEYGQDNDYTLWMNDTIVDAYLDLLVIKYPRNQSLGHNFYFGTYFMERLMDLSKMTTTDRSVNSSVYNYSAVKNWVERKLLKTHPGQIRKKTEKGFGLFMKAAVLYIPINCGIHWILATVHMDEQIICIYDSNSPTTRTFDDRGSGDYGLAILRCLHEFYGERQEGTFDVDNWTCQFPTCARQTNGVDCGVCMIAIIHMLVSGISPTTCINGTCWRNSILNCLVYGEILRPPATKST